MRYLCLIFMFFITATSLVSAEEKKTEINLWQLAQDLYREGKKALQEGDYQKANDLFKKAEEILSQPFNISQEEKQPLSMTVEGKKKLLLEKKRKSNENKKTISNEDLLLKAKDFYQKGKLKEALGIYKSLVAKNPKNSNLHYNLGVIYLGIREYLNAAHEFEKAILFNPKNAEAYYNLGVLYENYLNDRKKAIKYYKEYLKFSKSYEEKNTIKGWIDFLKRQEE